MRESKFEKTVSNISSISQLLENNLQRVKTVSAFITEIALREYQTQTERKIDQKTELTNVVNRDIVYLG